MKNESNTNQSLKRMRIYSAIVGGAAALFAAIFLFIVFRITSDQTMRMGNQQLTGMSKEVDSMLAHAIYEVDELADTVEKIQGEAGYSKAKLEQYIEEQSELQKKLSNGVCFRVCYTAPGCIIVPGEDISDDFDLTTRIWYNGAVQAGVGHVYISAPYADLFKGEICFSVAKLLSDGLSTVSLDFTMSEIQQYMSELPIESGKAILVNAEGMIVGANEDGLTGTQLEKTVPDMSIAWKNIKYAKEADGYYSRGGSIYFYQIMENGWYLIYGVNDLELHGGDYLVLAILICFFVITFLFVLLLLNRNRRSRQVAENALKSREEFFTNLSSEIKYPLEQINQLTGKRYMEDNENIEDNIIKIRESSLILNRLFDNLLAYSAIQNDEVGQQKDKKEKKLLNKNPKLIEEDEQAKNARHLGRMATTILVVLVPIVIVFSFYIIKRQGQIEMNNRVEIYYSELQEWVTGRKNTIDMMSSMLEANSDILNDYDKCVEYLGQIEKSYDGISLIYIGNDSAENPIIMSDGWTNNGNYVVQAYSWYANARSSREGYDISSVHYDIDSQQYVITFSQELRDKRGKFIGVLGVDFNVSDLIAALESMYTEEEYAFLITNSGAILNHPNAEYQISYSDVVSIDDSVYNNIQANEGISVLLDYDRKPVISAHREEEISGFQIYVVRTWGSIYGGVVSASVLFVLMILFSVSLVSVIWRRIEDWRNETSRKLERAVDEAYEANQAKSRFLAQMSHEIRTPINAVLGMNEMILRESNDESVLDHAKDIKQSGKMLLMLVNSILDFSKIENGNDDIVFIHYELKQLINDLVAEIRPLAQERNLQLTTKIDEKLPKILLGDRVKIMQIIVNLLTNAVKYTPKGSVTLKMSGDIDENGTLLLHVAVVDTGIGIREEDRNLLFKTFQRLDMEKNHSIEGTGLGLYIVNHFLEKMDSKLMLNSTYGEGSEFYFDIKQDVIDSAPIGSTADITREEEDVNREYLYAPNAKALIVDDNKMNRKVAAFLLKRSQMQIDLAESGAQCIEMIKENEYDVVLLDQMMPELNGVETLNKIREQKLLPENVPVIIMTAHAITGAREQYIKEGFDDYISKPIEAVNLEETLLKWLPSDKCKLMKAEDAEYIETKEAKAKESKTEDTKVVETEEAKADTVKAESYISFKNESLQKLHEEVPYIDMKNGFISCGQDEDFYIEMLNMFTNTGIQEELEGFMGVSDWKGYSISVHGFKNSAYSVGMQEIGDIAFELEQLSKSETVDNIPEIQTKMFEKYTLVCEKIKSMLS